MTATENVLHVECGAAGRRGELQPQRFRMGKRYVDVLEVLDHWRAPQHQFFSLSCDDGVYVLDHHLAADTWQLTMYSRYHLAQQLR
jgi:hypothetical protein